MGRQENVKKREAGDAAVDRTEIVLRRYDLENEFLDTLGTGDSRKAEKAFRKFLDFLSSEEFSSRLNDTLRDRKDLLITLNTIMRKSVERYHVPPVFIDHTSNDNIRLIESIENPEVLDNITSRMIRSYCSLVKEYSPLKYSPLIREAVEYIQNNLRYELNLTLVAEQVSANRSYLSTRFHQETGFTMTEFIKRARVKEAGLLLVTTSLSLPEVAAQVGYADYNYFSRVFLEITGIRPSGYRRST